jgi:hypothetical protein
VEGLRSNALWEAIYLLHKAAHVMRASQSHAAQGFRSWCLFDAYHGAYLAAKSVMGLLGVVIPQLDGQQTVIDLFPVVQEKPRKKDLLLGRESQFRILKTGQLDQRNLWELFQRVLRMSTVQCASEGLVQSCVDLDWEDISRARNPYLYRATFWNLDDLHVEAAVAAFATPKYDNQGDLSLSIENEAFLLELCFTVFVIGRSMLKDLASEIAPMAQEFNLLQSADFAARNHLLLRRHPEIVAA